MDYKIAIIGNHEEILGFKALGLFPIAVNSTEDAKNKFNEIVNNKDYAIVFVTENWAQKIQDVLLEHRGALPAVVTIPNYAGSKGMGEQKLRRIVEKAVGSDILFKEK